MNECSKATIRRVRDPNFANVYFVGDGIDVGAGADSLWHQRHHFPRMTSVYPWDRADGDAETLPGVKPNSYDFLHSSHCLEHVEYPYTALGSWIEVVKPGGHIIVTVPDEDMYEQGVWPSTFNPDHRRTFGMCKPASWSPVSIGITTALLPRLPFSVEIVKVERITEHFDPTGPRRDQTLGPAECAIEFILRKPL